MYQALMIFVAGLVACGLVAAFVQSLRSDLVRPTFWLVLLTIAGVVGAVSVFVRSTRHAGTGLTTSHGWPKPFYFRYLSETGEQSTGFHLAYFLGNSLAFAGGLLILWTLWRVIRR